MDIEYKIAAIKDGKIIGLKKYDLAGDRDANVAAAVNSLAAELGIEPPASMPRSRGVTGPDGTEWGRMSADVAGGMVEVGFGKWGFA